MFRRNVLPPCSESEEIAISKKQTASRALCLLPEDGGSLWSPVAESLRNTVVDTWTLKMESGYSSETSDYSVNSEDHDWKNLEAPLGGISAFDAPRNP
jgi:hypothetical protein